MCLSAYVCVCYLCTFMYVHLSMGRQKRGVKLRRHSRIARQTSLPDHTQKSEAGCDGDCRLSPVAWVSIVGCGDFRLS